MTSPPEGRGRTLKAFLWLTVLGWAIGLGAKLFDLLVVATAWGASPPASFERLPYGKNYPVDPGNFFQPLSAVMAIGLVGALIAGWKRYERAPLLVAFGSFVVIWILTPTIFWPMINQLWEIHRGRLSRSDLEVVELVHRWFIWDSLRVVLIAIGFISAVRALCFGDAERKTA